MRSILSANRRRTRPPLQSIAAVTMAVLAGCAATAVQRDAAKAGSSAAVAGTAGALDKCGEPLGTLLIDENRAAPWYRGLGERQLGSSVPVLQWMAQQSNCFTAVERSSANTAAARAAPSPVPAKSAALAADYTVTPSIDWPRGPSNGAAQLASGSTTGQDAPLVRLLLTDNRGRQAGIVGEGLAKGVDGATFGLRFSGLAMAGGGYASTASGKAVAAAWADAFNQVTRKLRTVRPLGGDSRASASP